MTGNEPGRRDAAFAAPLSYARQFITGASGEAFSQGVTIVTQLVMIPALLLIWGPDRLGIWLIISAVPTYLTLGDLGLTTIFGNEITARHVAGRQEAVQVAVHTSWFTTRVVTIFAVVAAVLLSVAAPAIAPATAAASPTEIQLTVLFLCLSVCLVLAQSTVGACMRVMGQYGALTATNALSRLVESAAIISSACFSTSLMMAAILSFSARLLVFLTLRIYFLRRYPAFTPRTTLADRGLLKSLLPASGGFLSFTIGNSILIQTPTIIVGSIISPSAAVMFVAARTLARMGRMLVAIINYAIEPILAQLATSNTSALEKTTYLHRRFILLACAIYLPASVFFGPPFLNWWTHGTYGNDFMLYYALVIAILFEIGWTTIQVPYHSTNRQATFGYAYLIISAISLVLMFFCAHLDDLTYIGLCILVCHGVFLTFTIWTARRVAPRFTSTTG